jgi:F0F1-type ATP synthase membrane subunit b/b'
MNLSFSPLSVLLAAFAPLLVLILAIVWNPVKTFL